MQNGQSREFLRKYNGNICVTPSKMHMHDMVKIDTIVFEIVSCLKYPRSNRHRVNEKLAKFEYQ